MKTEVYGFQLEWYYYTCAIFWLSTTDGVVILCGMSNGLIHFKVTLPLYKTFTCFLCENRGLWISIGVTLLHLFWFFGLSTTDNVVIFCGSFYWWANGQSIVKLHFPPWHPQHTSPTPQWYVGMCHSVFGMRGAYFSDKKKSKIFHKGCKDFKWSCLFVKYIGKERKCQKPEVGKNKLQFPVNRKVYQWCFILFLN